MIVSAGSYDDAATEAVAVCHLWAELPYYFVD
jgi:hypothetical protein